MRTLMVLIISLMLTGFSQSAELTIGLIPEQNVFKQIKRYRPIGDYVEKKTGVKIKYTILPRYGNIIESFKMKKMDGAFWGSFTGAMAIKKLGVEPIVRPVNLDGLSTYRGYIFVHKNSMIDSVERMRHSVIAFVDKATTAGYIFPVAYFREKGVRNIESYFKEYYFAGSHDAAIFAVLEKEAEVGCAKNTIFDMLARQDSRVRDDLVILVESPEVPSNGLGLIKEVSSEVKMKLQKTFIEMDNDPEGREVLSTFGALRFIETSEADYAPVFELARKAGIDLRHYDYEND
ncbi:MAG: phosphate/phosphite/phosphonate ABC transporter substrate-binding protein [Nitrospiraceae bacterium]|nr:MAG: phosphate/phosphite/phosphonate ABC transporter substrate-binding protein [Nitrospiraceae bacterium]